MKVKYILSAILILAVLCLGAFGYVYSIVMSPQIELDETVYVYIDKSDKWLLLYPFYGTPLYCKFQQKKPYIVGIRENFSIY